MSSTSSTTPIPLTTPFIFPSNCSNRFPDSIIETKSYVSGSYTYHIFPSKENDPLCQPSGVTTYPTPGRQFSPAVCPSAWTAYDVRVLTYHTGTVSVARCCSSGFTFNSGYSIPWYSSAGGVCTQSTSLANTTITTTNTVTGYPRPSDIRAHVAWQVSWQFSDRSTLSPMPPTLSDECNNAQLPTWVPGTPSTLEDCQKPTYEHISSSYASFLWFVIIGIPLIAFAIILLCVWNCCRRKKKKKFAAISARQARERAAAQAGAGAKNYDTNVVAGSAGAGIELSETKKQVDSTQYMGHM